MTYAKLIDNKLVYWKGYERIGNRDIITTDPTPYGWKEVVYAKPEQRDGFYTRQTGWTEAESTIEATYEYVEIPQAEEQHSEEDTQNGNIQT